MTGAPQGEREPMVTVRVCQDGKLVIEEPASIPHSTLRYVEKSFEVEAEAGGKAVVSVRFDFDPPVVVQEESDA